MFLKQMSRRKFILKSQKFQEMRENQELPHTCSRQGYARLEYQMQKESPNPSSITRVDVWCKGHTKKSGEPSNNIVAERMKKMKEIRDSATSDSFNHSIQNDALSQVLGPDRYSRVRGKGARLTPSKLGVVSQDKQMVTQLQKETSEEIDLKRRRKTLASCVPPIIFLRQPIVKLSRHRVSKRHDFKNYANGGSLLHPPDAILAS
ncbi:hypothetical protein IFM89_039371 [Coptis chinensis]|uniref:Uncharacterized protein n=1 Tax=Coptis chinensis TaxID=261450 RepID=A0A835IHG5_9MAGN|nr:hypothetical protein IFM89_039371 [Coptis chinensis]